MKIDRLLSIIIVLLEQKKISAAKLSQMFEVSTRTIYRDIETIQSAGIPIITHAGINGGISIMEKYKLDKNFFTREDINTLMTGLGNISSVISNSEVTGITLKLKSLMPEKFSQEQDFRSNQVIIDMTTWGGSRRLQRNMDILKKALIENRIVKFGYFDGSGRTSVRTVEPYHLLMKEEKWYLNSFCILRNDFRLFKLSRISSLELLEDSFTPREIDAVSLQTSWVDKRYIVIKLLADISLKETLLEKCEEEDIIPCENQKLLVYFPFVDDDFGYDLLMSFGNRCQCLEPPKVREELIRRIENTLKLYR